jgi:hypothetical protein
VLGHLADEPRLRAYAAVVLGAGTSGEVCRRAGLRQRDALRALERLERGGLVDRGGPGGSLRARVEPLQRSVAAASERPEPTRAGDGEPGAAVLRAFFRAGRLERIPSTRSKRLVVLDHVCRVFEPGHRYPEREVDVMLRAFHDDHAALRRHLVDEGFLSRGEGAYWRTGGTVET